MYSIKINNTQAMRHLRHDPTKYIIIDNLTIDVVNAAINLGKPLLLTGEPGVGKTQLAYNVAHKLGLDAPLVFLTRQDTIIRDLYYTFDTDSYLLALRSGQQSTDPLDYITFGPLGQAVLRTISADKVLDKSLSTFLKSDNPKRSLLLVEEIDNASSDLTIDLINELEVMYFRIPELNGLTIEGDPRCQPLTIITAGSLKSLKKSFLQRCIHHHLQFPAFNELNAMVTRIYGEILPRESEQLFNEIIDAFLRARQVERRGYRKPGIHQLFDFINLILESGIKPGESLEESNSWPTFCRLAWGLSPEEFISTQERYNISEKQLFQVKIFISYSTEDRKIAQRLYEYLQKEGFGCYYFEQSATGGNPIWTTVSNEIKSADVFIALISKSSNGSRFVQNEINHANYFLINSGNPKLIIPVRLEKSVEIPTDIRRFCAVDLHHFESGFELIVKAINQIDKSNSNQNQ